MTEIILYGDSSIEPPTEPTHCAISGVRLQAGDLAAKIAGTPYSYGVAAQYVHELNTQKRSEIEAKAPRPVVPLSRQLKVSKEGE